MSRRLFGRSRVRDRAPVIGYAPEGTEGGHGSVGAYAPRSSNQGVVLVLVAAHAPSRAGQTTKATGGEPPPHYLRDYIEGQIRKRYPERPFHVVTTDRSVPDITKYQPSVDNDGHYVNKRKFDMVFLPDLGADDELLLAVLEPERDTATIVEILTGSLGLVTEGGWLYFSKIWEPHRKAGRELGATLQDSVFTMAPLPDNAPKEKSDFMAIHKKKRGRATVL